MQARKQPVDTFVLGRGDTCDADQAAETARDQRQHRHQREWRARRQRICQTANRRAADGRDLPGAGCQRGRPLQHAFWCHGRQQRRRGRAFERACQPEHSEYDEYLGRGQRAREKPHGEIEGGEPLRQLAKLDDAAAIVAVSGVAGDEDEQRARNELHQTGEAEIEGAAGQRIDLPAYGDRCDLIGEFRQGARGDVEQQRRMSRQRDGRGGKCGSLIQGNRRSWKRDGARWRRRPRRLSAWLRRRRDEAGHDPADQWQHHQQCWKGEEP